MKNLKIGITGTSELTVCSENLAVNVGSGSLEVFATPEMVMLMEKKYGTDKQIPQLIMAGASLDDVKGCLQLYFRIS